MVKRKQKTFLLLIHIIEYNFIVRCRIDGSCPFRPNMETTSKKSFLIASLKVTGTVLHRLELVLPSRSLCDCGAAIQGHQFLLQLRLRL
jgi:hypothetical protein